jgi:CheY-like chemotaxis protein
MNDLNDNKTVEILLVEDNPGDALLTLHSLEMAKISSRLHVVEDGDQAMAFLRKEGEHHSSLRPDLILLDLNLPGKDGRQVLAEIKRDEDLCTIPVVILTSSAADEDLRYVYRTHANSYILKPINFEQLCQIINCLLEYWFRAVKLPSRTIKKRA